MIPTIPYDHDGLRDVIKLSFVPQSYVINWPPRDVNLALPTLILMRIKSREDQFCDNLKVGEYKISSHIIIQSFLIAYFMLFTGQQAE